MNKNCNVKDSNRVGWIYSNKVKDHFIKPRNFITKDEPKGKFNGVGEVGNMACGDLMRVWIYVDPKTDRIKKCKWQTFGCASAIASTSVMSEMVTEGDGMKITQAKKLTPQAIVERLGGLPERKIHCSVLGDRALKEAINDYRQTGLI